jgi:uncharacterized protein RhaS with RHS repeats
LDHKLAVVYNYFRTYDPSTGRYRESDPIGLEGGLNTYGYALQNPLRYADPTGEAVPIVVACAANPYACGALVDTNEVWVTFSVAREAFDGVEACERSSRDEVVLPRKAGLGWWPVVLSEGSDGGQSTPSGYVFYRCGTAAFVAVDDAKGFFWLRGGN